jgi:hypothetical protein
LLPAGIGNTGAKARIFIYAIHANAKEGVNQMPKKKSKSKSDAPRKDSGAARLRKAKQEQVDELHGLLKQLDPSLKRPKVK